MAVWFGFKSLNLGPTAILHIGLKSAAVVGACSFVLAPAAAAFLVPWRDLACNAGFVLLSVGSAVLPTVLFALFSPEFPLVAGEVVRYLGVVPQEVFCRGALQAHMCRPGSSTPAGQH
jgi:L-lactate permease